MLLVTGVILFFWKMLTLDRILFLLLFFYEVCRNFKVCFLRKHCEILKSAETWALARTDFKTHLCHSSWPQVNPSLLLFSLSSTSAKCGCNTKLSDQWWLYVRYLYVLFLSCKHAITFAITSLQLHCHQLRPGYRYF